MEKSQQYMYHAYNTNKTHGSNTNIPPLSEATT